MKCDAIILAAGYSSRAKTNKMALCTNEQPILASLIETFYPLCDDILTHGDYPMIQRTTYNQLVNGREIWSFQRTKKERASCFDQKRTYSSLLREPVSSHNSSYATFACKLCR